MTDRDGWPRRFHIAPAKVTEYLLNPHHRDGAAKCRFLAAFGFEPGKPDDLIRALFDHSRQSNFRGLRQAHRAVKLYFEGPLTTMSGPAPQVRTVWQVDEADESRTARFITLKPLPRPRH